MKTAALLVLLPFTLLVQKFEEPPMRHEKHEGRTGGVNYQQDNLTYDMITHGAQMTVGIEF